MAEMSSHNRLNLESFMHAQARELAQRMHNEVLPTPLKGFNGQKLSTDLPWVVRIDVGYHTETHGEMDEDGKRVCFLNEIEILPALYIAKKFGHAKDYLAHYAQVHHLHTIV